MFKKYLPGTAQCPTRADIDNGKLPSVCCLGGVVSSGRYLQVLYPHNLRTFILCLVCALHVYISRFDSLQRGFGPLIM